MKKLLGILAPLVVGIAGGVWLAWSLAMAGPGGCPTALLQGTLVELDGTLGIQPTWTTSSPVRVQWPFGYGVDREGDTLVLKRVFSVVAREGDEVSAGGGSGTNDSVFIACGPVDLGLSMPPEPSPSTPPSAKLTIAASVYEPCLPPPSGCAYWASITSTASGTDRAELVDGRSYEDAAAGLEAPLAQADGLPRFVEPGVYDLSFETWAYSDVASPRAEGMTGEEPLVAVACTTRLQVPEGTLAVRVDVTFRYSACTARVTGDDGRTEPVDRGG